MQELLTFLAQSLVDHPDKVHVSKTEGSAGETPAVCLP